MRTRKNLARSGSRWQVALAVDAAGGAEERSSGVRAVGVELGGEEGIGTEGEEVGTVGADSVSIGSTTRGRGPNATA